jgi:hypothetical protein
VRRKRRKWSLQSIDILGSNFVSCSNSKRKQVKGQEVQRKRGEKAAPRKKEKKKEKKM